MGSKFDELIEEITYTIRQELDAQGVLDVADELGIGHLSLNEYNEDEGHNDAISRYQQHCAGDDIEHHGG